MPQRANRGSWTKGDPRAKAAGAKGGKTMRYKRSPDYIAGYSAGFMAGRRSQKGAA